MGLILKFFKSKYLRFLANKNPILYARKLGVNIEDGVMFTGHVNYGSEPWLVEIKKGAWLTNNVSFITHDGSVHTLRHYAGKGYEYIIKFGKIVVDEYSFIGVGSTIMPNVRIGKHSIVGVGSLVTKDIPDGEVWAGVPAKRIGSVKEIADKFLDRTPPYDDDELNANKIKVSKEIAEHYWKLTHNS